MHRVRAFVPCLMAILFLVPGGASAQLNASGSAFGIDRDARLAESAAEQLAPRAASAELLAPVDATVMPDVAEVEDFMPVQQARARNRAGVPLMVGGGVLFVAGAIIGGDAGTILMIGGAGAGAYGAYVYFGG